VNAYDLPSRTFWSAASTTYHEAVPGHHFQIALEMELPALAHSGAWLEDGGRGVRGGLGPVQQRLADELGLYRSPAERSAC
jgi:uncharacterized protein (DUF885 family)